jgi:hypothetical protein
MLIKKERGTFLRNYFPLPLFLTPRIKIDENFEQQIKEQYNNIENTTQKDHYGPT